MKKQKYRVLVDENFHFMDIDERYGSGAFDTFDQAVSKCTKIIDDYLKAELHPNETAESLYISWRMYGENPFIDGGDVNQKFSSAEYARLRCSELTKAST